MPHPEPGESVVINLLDCVEIGHIHLKNLFSRLVIASQSIGYVLSVVGKSWIGTLVFGHGNRIPQKTCLFFHPGRQASWCAGGAGTQR